MEEIFDEVVIVFWYIRKEEDSTILREMMVFENQERADAFMNAHPHRSYYYQTVRLNPDETMWRPQSWFPA